MTNRRDFLKILTVLPFGVGLKNVISKPEVVEKVPVVKKKEAPYTYASLHGASFVTMTLSTGSAFFRPG